MQQSDAWIEALRKYQPFSATGYVLEIQFDDESLTRFPREGCYNLEPLDIPSCPAGTYRVLYVSGTGKAVPIQDPSVPILRVEIDLGLRPKQRTRSNKELAGEAIETTNEASRVVDSAPDEPAEERSEEEKLTRIDRELQQAIMAQEIDDTAQDLLNKSQYVRELSEHYAMHRVMRRDFQLLYEQAVDNAKRMGEVIRHFSDLHADGMAKLKTQIDLYTRPPPPPPPPDYSALGQAAIGFLRDVSVALIQKSSANSKRLKQLPSIALGSDATAEPTLESDSASRIAQASTESALREQPEPLPIPIVAPPQIDSAQAEGILKRLRGLDELQLAAMSASPELMQKFFEFMRAADSVAPASPEPRERK